MSENIEYNQWAACLSEFNRRNRWRPTRLVVFDETSAQEIERGMPFVGLSLDADRQGATCIHLMLGDHDAMDPRHQTYTITGVKAISSKCGFDGRDESLEIKNEQGETNLLRFEPLPQACSIGPFDEAQDNFEFLMQA